MSNIPPPPPPPSGYGASASGPDDEWNGFGPPPGFTPPPPRPPTTTDPMLSGGMRPPSNTGLAVAALVVSVLCCGLFGIPLGVVAVVKASQVDKRWHTGDRAGAHSASAAARTLSFVVFGIAALMVVVFVALLVFGGPFVAAGAAPPVR